MTNFQDVLRDVHDPSLHALKTTASLSASTVYVGNPTLYAVVNTGAAGDSTANIGFATVAVSTPTLYAVVNTGAAGVGNSIVTVANPNFGINAGVNGIGFATVNVVNQPALVASTANIGSVSVLGGIISLRGNVTLSNPNTYIGLTTATIGNNPVLGAGVNNIGFATVKIDAGTQFIGLVTAWNRNAGTTKTLIPLPVGLGNNSLATVAVPTNANKINLTQLILNSNVTTEIAIMSGVTYLTGNASLGVTLFPGGGFVMNGSPDSPAWIGLPSGAMVVEKRDGGGTVSKIAGNVIYFDE